MAVEGTHAKELSIINIIVPEKNARDTLSQRKRGLEVLAENLGDIKRSERCHFNMVEDLEPFKLHLTSMSYINEVFEHLLQL